VTLFWLSIGWTFFLLVLTIWLINKRVCRVIPKYPYLFLFILAFFLRIIPGGFLVQGSNYDIDSYSIVANHVLAREDVYTAEDTQGRHPYLPFELYWMAFAKWASNLIHVTFSVFVKMLPIIADSAIAVMIYLYLIKEIPPNKAFFGGLLYAVNPITIMVSSYQGQFDAVAMLFLIACIYEVKRSFFSAGSWLGFGILAKSWPVLALPSVMAAFNSIKHKIAVLILSSLIPLVGALFYIYFFHANLITVITKALSYNHGIGIWGYTYFLRLMGTIFSGWWAYLYNFILGNGRFITLGILIIVWYTTARKEKLTAGLLTILVSFFAFTHAFAIQYLLWLVPVIILNMEYTWLKLYILACFSYMLLAYNTVILHMSITNLLPWPTADLAIIIPASIPIWLVTFAWAISRIKHGNKTQLSPMPARSD
jgi:hypothetical protein